MTSLRLGSAQHHGSAVITPAARGVFVQGSVTSPSRQRWRGAHTSNGGNKQGTSNRGTQPPTTIIGITWIHARSGQPLALTLNETVRGLTYKQEVAGSSPAPPMVDYQRSCARVPRQARKSIAPGCELESASGSMFNQ